MSTIRYNSLAGHCDKRGPENSEGDHFWPQLWSRPGDSWRIQLCVFITGDLISNACDTTFIFSTWKKTTSYQYDGYLSFHIISSRSKRHVLIFTFMGANLNIELKSLFSKQKNRFWFWPSRAPSSILSSSVKRPLHIGSRSVLKYLLMFWTFSELILSSDTLLHYIEHSFRGWRSSKRISPKK